MPRTVGEHARDAAIAASIDQVWDQEWAAGEIARLRARAGELEAEVTILTRVIKTCEIQVEGMMETEANWRMVERMPEGWRLYHSATGLWCVERLRTEDAPKKTWAWDDPQGALRAAGLGAKSE